MKIIDRIKNILYRSSVLDEIRRILAQEKHESAQLRVLLTHRELDRLRSLHRYRNPKMLVSYGYKIYSQNDEDGIIKEIFARIGITNKIFVEIGVGDGLENNTAALLLESWSGLWVDADAHSMEKIRKHFTEIIAKGKLQIAHCLVTESNVDEILSSRIDQAEIDLLSIDIDGNDLHILNAIDSILPRVIVIEYNAKFVPPILYSPRYDKNHNWQSDDHFGASLKSLEFDLYDKGYALVGCNLIGTNAFFVRHDLVLDKFAEPFTAEMHYEPARYYLAGYASGHRPSYLTIVNSSS